MKMAKKASESETILTEVMMPVHANHYGNVHGGTILKLVDEAALVAATRHSRKNVVLASMDHISFKHPVNIGDMLNIRARLCYVGRSSMEIEVDIKAEDLKEGRTFHVGSAYLTMVALDKNGRSANIPKLIFETEDEKRKSRELFARRERRRHGA